MHGLCKRAGVKPFGIHPEEDDVLSKAIDAFKLNRDLLVAMAEKLDLDVFGWALAYLDEIWDQVKNEYEANKAAKTLDCPLCLEGFRSLVDDGNEKATELAAAKMLLLQAECYVLPS